MFKYNAKVERVVDGDTVDALVDLGFSTWKKVRIRMMGINAPESRTRDLKEIAAKARLEELLDKGDFILESHGVGKFGRCLGSLHVGDINVNKVLVSEGHANEYFGGKR